MLNDEEIHAHLKQRVARWHLKQRLGIERDYETRVFGQGRNFFHIENWYSIHALIRLALRLALLHGRGRRNARDIRLRHNRFELDLLPPAFDGFTILHLSDLHIDIAGDMSRVIAERVQGLAYDLCVITGDMRAQTFGDYQAALSGMAHLRRNLNGPVYAVLGNHDSIRMVPELERQGIQLLLNEAIALQRGDEHIYLAGIDDPHYYRADNLERASEQIPDEVVTILLSHSPEIYRHAAFTDFNVMLCGHTHGGQICLPGGIMLMSNARCPRAMTRGKWDYAGLQGYTSVGTGSCVVDVRLNCPPEITLHELSRPA